MLDAAEILIAGKGIDSFSVREINRVAGARNTSAAQYHFGDRDGVLAAIVSRHHDDTESRRHALLDQYEATRRRDVRELAAALVRPLAAKLSDGDGGAAYLAILANRLTRDSPIINPGSLGDPGDSIFRWRLLLDDVLDPEVVRLHRRFVANRFATVELARRARNRRGEDHRHFIAHLIDLVAGILLAPVSDETRDLRRPS